MEITEVNATRILNPTSIDLGDYVINPYKGCMYACLYCYVRFNKVVLKEERDWGDYVYVRINSAELLKKELKAKRPKRVLLGSTTECFAPQEKKYKITAKILDILNEERVRYSILTRAPLITEYIEKLDKDLCENVYFTVNDFSDELKKELEPRSPEFEERVRAVNELNNAGVHVIPYISPVLPGITKFDNIFDLLKRVNRIEFEGLNFSLGNIRKVVESISKIYPHLEAVYEKMLLDEKFYNSEWKKVRQELIRTAIKYKQNQHIFIHGFKAYFENKYIER